MDTALPADCARRFRALTHLATGGFGTVWRAVQLELDRPVAIKVLDEKGQNDPEQLARFAREARVTAALVHPHVVRVIDHGAGAGVPWIAFELVEGQSLRERLDRGPMNPDDALRAAAQVADALACAHAAGVLHRDIKPENVLDAGDGMYKVADFGIATFSAESSIQTAAGTILGTPAYVSPEQVTGRDATPASDMYALGCMLYEMLVGRVPHQGADVRGTLTAHLKVAAAPPSASQPGLPPEVDRLVLALLAKDPAARPAAAACRDALDALVRHGVTRRVVEPGPGDGEPRQRASRKARTARATRPEAALPAGSLWPRVRAAALGALGAGALVLVVALIYHAAPAAVTRPAGVTQSASSPTSSAAPDTSPLFWGEPVHALAVEFEQLQARGARVAQADQGVLDRFGEVGSSEDGVGIYKSSTLAEIQALLDKVAQILPRQRRRLDDIFDVASRARTACGSAPGPVCAEFLAYVRGQAFYVWNEHAAAIARFERLKEVPGGAEGAMASLDGGLAYQKLDEGTVLLVGFFDSANAAILAIPGPPAPLPPPSLRFLSRVNRVATELGYALRRSGANTPLGRAADAPLAALGQAAENNLIAALARDFFRVACGEPRGSGTYTLHLPAKRAALRASVRDRLIALRGRIRGVDPSLENLIADFTPKPTRR